MKALVCEMCGGSNLVKQEGVFVCQNCKTKYSVEEAKRMMIEGTVDVSGSTVKVDNTAKLDNLYKIARRAREDANFEQALKYYEQLLTEDPENWEPAFFTSLYSCMNILKNDSPGGSVQIRSGRVNLTYDYRTGISLCIERISNCLDSVYSLIENEERDDDKIAAANLVFSEVLLVLNELDDVIENEHERMDGEIRNFITETTDASGVTGVVGMIAKQRIELSKMSKINDGNRDEYLQVIENLENLVTNHKTNIEAVVQNRRIDEFWAENPTLKGKLKSLRQTLSVQLDSLNQEMTAVPGYSELGNLHNHIQQLIGKKNSLSIFKGKEKQAIQVNIDKYNRQYENLYNQVNPAIMAVQQRIDTAQSKISYIDARLINPLSPDSDNPRDGESKFYQSEEKWDYDDLSFGN